MTELNKSGKNVWEYFVHNSIYFLAGALLLFIALPPFLQNEYAFRYSILILTTIIVGFVILILPDQKLKRPLWHWILTLFLIFPWIMDIDNYVNSFILICFGLLYSFTSYRIIKFILQEATVDLRVVVGSVVGYLMIGLSFTFFCALLAVYSSESFEAPDLMTSSYSFIYFTFVTLSTLGYGDITPVTPMAQALSLIIAITGQFYMVLIVAVIVGKFISMRPKNQVNL